MKLHQLQQQKNICRKFGVAFRKGWKRKACRTMFWRRMMGTPQRHRRELSRRLLGDVLQVQP